jgi:hypothetical protein
VTLVLAWMTATHAILGADRVILSGPVGGPFVRGDADKIFLTAGCVVASFGTSPPDLHVSTLVLAENDAVAPPSALAHRLKRRIDALSKTGAFGLLVLGNGRESCELWELGSDRNPVKLNAVPGAIISRGQPIDLAPAPCSENPDAAIGLMISIFLQAERQNVQVGHPFDFGTIAWPRPPDFVRCGA